MNEKKLNKIIICFFIVLSIPIFILSFYNVPCADDYTFGRMLHSWVEENGYHFFGMLKCAVQNSIDYYFNWQGRYSESFFASFMPDIFGYYWIWAIFLYCTLTIAIIYLFRTLINNLIGKDYAAAGVSIGVLVCTVIVQNIPFPVEAFFWFDGSLAYMFHHILYIWMCAIVVRYFFEKNKRMSMSQIVLLSILAILVAGGNNVTAFISILTYCFFIGITFLIRRKRGIFLPAILSVAGFTVSYLSPGTRIRGGDSSNYTPVLLAIRKCFVWTIKQYLLKWTTVVFILFLLILTPFLLKIVKNISEKYSFCFPFPFLAVVGMVCFLSAMSCPSFYILGEPGPGRMGNIIYINYVILMVLVYGYLLGWLLNKYGNTSLLILLDKRYQNCSSIFRLGMILCVFILLCLGNSGQLGMSVEATKELISGQAALYHKEATIRKNIYLDAAVDVVEVEPFSVKPALLFFDDITDDPENWKNIAVRDYFGKETVKLSHYDPEVDYD